MTSRAHAAAGLFAATGILLAGLGIAAAAGVGLAAGPVATPIIDDMPALAAIAAPASGQTLYCLDGGSRGVIAVDPRTPASRREAVAATATGPRPVGIACLDSTTLAAVCVDGDAWSVRTWQLQPGRPADPATPLQAVNLGTATERPTIAPTPVVGHSRQWLAIVGLPAPLPAVVRMPLAGARLGAASDQHCPKIAAGVRPIAGAAGLDDELVIVTTERRAAAPADVGDHALVTSYSAAGRPMLTLGTGLEDVRAVACGRDNGTLWVLAQGKEPGLWRLDATFIAGRQAIRGRKVAALAAPQALVCLADRTLAVLLGPPDPRLVRLDLDTPEPAAP